MRIATWNINSLRARLERVEAWLIEVEPDVVLLQETKLADAKYVIHADLTSMGGKDAVATAAQAAVDWPALGKVVVDGLSRDETLDFTLRLGLDLNQTQRRRLNKSSLLDALNDARFQCAGKVPTQ